MVGRIMPPLRLARRRVTVAAHGQHITWLWWSNRSRVAAATTGSANTVPHSVIGIGALLLQIPIRPKKHYRSRSSGLWVSNLLSGVMPRASREAISPIGSSSKASARCSSMASTSMSPPPSGD